MKMARKSLIKNEKGIASVETVVLLVLFTSLVYYTFGFFGVIHTAVVHNIHARTYAFETFRHRTNLRYFRSNRPSISHYYNRSSRLHGINSDADRESRQTAAEQPLTMGLPSEEVSRLEDIHNNQIPARVQRGQRNSTVGVNPVWIMVMYGICFDAECGGAP